MHEPWNAPWKSKTKQRMAFRMIQKKDSPLPMGKIWFLDSLVTYIFLGFAGVGRVPSATTLGSLWKNAVLKVASTCCFSIGATNQKLAFLLVDEEKVILCKKKLPNPQNDARLITTWVSCHLCPASKPFFTCLCSSFDSTIFLPTKKNHDIEYKTFQFDV